MSPKHVAIIMDGNRRWAQTKGLSFSEGYKKGVENLYTTLENSIKLNVKYLTVFGFSTENWRRSTNEVSDLMDLFNIFLDEAINKIKKKNVKVRFIGDLSKFTNPTQSKINMLTNISKNNIGLTLTLAVNYGGRFDIVQAVNKIIIKNNTKLSEKKFCKYILNSDIPSPDLLIRTGGQKRLSNFMLWDLAYTELLFLPEMWPEFDFELFKFAINEYNKRIRNYGGSYN